MRAGGGDDPYRADRHRDHHLQRALQHRAALRLHRPYQRGAGWNLVTSQIEDEARNFGYDEHVPHAERYERAAEFHDIVVGLWDSWEADALLRDKEAGIYLDRDKVHALRHVGKHFKVRGPLNIARCPQGRPVVAQAGSSEAGRELAAKTADVVFTAQTDMREARAFYADVKGRAARRGHPHHAGHYSRAGPH